MLCNQSMSIAMGEYVIPQAKRKKPHLYTDAVRRLRAAV